ncbi:DUF6901 family protein [Beggiatoa leptomitoformis]|uniref:Uncharacterized protein n=1 Tax=Beggiatoa leptomitoformis TaxID=288004 RepID=A0A2N9YJ74_9GAMM|nr:hypothetical protein [Beggiatoa leptomitoformis]ALG69520.2 hypothetical protein AL038_14975 [Beggiatoa leptomitoformis]AUI70581.2 hypothetical protein BLE401_09280 [Beggiatoa leptomitoformis]
MFDSQQMFIEYTFTMDDGKVLHYKIHFERPRPNVLNKADYPRWTELDFHQCSNCPLDMKEYSHCPAAIDAKEIILGFCEILSCSAADVRVRTPEREYIKRSDAQTGLRALIGFVMATSACPLLSKMRGMAHYHLPFASLDEIVFRVTSSYLLKQYYNHQDGGVADLELNGLKMFYEEMQTLNYDFLQRIRAAASEADSNLDVLSTLFSISALLSLRLEPHLEKLKPLFVDKTNDVKKI